MARRYAESEKEVIQEVAAHLDDKGTLSGSQIDEIRNDVKRGERVTVTQTNADGVVEVFEARAKDGIVMLPSRMYNLDEQKAA